MEICDRTDQDGIVLDIQVQVWRDAQAAKRFFKRLTDKLRSYGVAQRQMLPASSIDRADI